MKVTYFSNYLNHLQTSLCDEFYNLCGNNFTFVSTEKLPSERIYSGYEDCSHYTYNLNSFENKINFNKALELGIESDIVIIGAASEVFIKERLKQDKITFRYSERILKRGEWMLFSPHMLFSLIRYHTYYRKNNLYMLCTSAFAAIDFNLVFSYPKKKYKWGYFTEVKELNIEEVLINKPINKIEIVWTARFIDWKHPELAVKLAYQLKRKGYNFHISMIGAGILVDKIKDLILKLDVSDCISLLGSMSNLEVRNYMLKSNIFILTSDRNEGWGVVLNEAMSCGCSIVAANNIGSVPYLIKDEKNGLIFKSKNLLSLVEKTEKLINNNELRNELSKNSYFTIKNEWSPKIAANNFLILAESILSNNKIEITKGPCSKA